MSRPRQVSLVGRVVSTGSVLGPLTKRKAAAVQIVAGPRVDKTNVSSLPLAVASTNWLGSSVWVETRSGMVRVPLAQAKLLFAGGEMDRPRRFNARRRRAVPELEVPDGEAWILERPIPSGARVHLVATLTLDPSAAVDDSATWVARPGLGPIVLTVVNDRAHGSMLSAGWVAALVLFVVASIGVTFWLLRTR